MQGVLVKDYRTLKQASAEKGCQYDALRMWVRVHQVPTERIGRSVLVRLSDLAEYVPRGTKDVLGVR